MNSKGNRPWRREQLAKDCDDFLYFDRYNQIGKYGNRAILNDISVDIIMGHVRHATVGAVTHANSHPFDVGRYVGSHNGTLKDKQYQSNDKTDSEMMFRDINARGVDAVLSGLQEDSAYAITMYDRERHELVVARNDKRTLFYAMLKDRDVLYWASEDKMLDLVLERSGEKYDVFYFEPGNIYHLNTTHAKRGCDNAFTSRKLGTALPTAPAVEIKPRVKAVNNVVHLPDLRNKEVKASVETPRIPEVTCNHCSTPMTLVDQHYGRCNPNGTYTCEPCVQDQESNIESLIARQTTMMQ